MHLVEALLRLHEELAVELDATVFTDVELRDPTLHPVGIELIVPCLVQPVRYIHPLAITAYLNHLRTAVERAGVRMRGTSDDSAEMHRAGFLGVERIGDVVLEEFAGPPARDIKEAVVQGEVDVAHQRRHSLESLEDGRELFGIGRLRRD